MPCMRGNYSKNAVITVFGRCALATGIALLVAACGLPSRTPVSTGHDSTHRTAIHAAACTRKDLRIRLDRRLVTMKSGTRHIPLEFTNTSRAACKLAGFPVVGVAYGQKGSRIGGPSTLDRADKAAPVLVRPRHVAHLWILLAEVAKLPAAVCRPVTAAGLRIKLPGQRRATFVRHRVTTCSRKIRGADILTVEPFQAGKAKRHKAH
jgi:hypothetical protein